MEGTSPTRVGVAPGTGAPATDEAFAAWVEPHLAVVGWTVARLAPPAERDDVLQEALVTAWRTRSTYDPARGSVRTWLCVIAADRARKAHRRLRRHPWEPLPADLAVDGGTGRDLDVERAVSSLPRRQREAVSLRYFVGLTTAETAAVMRCSEGTVKSTLSDARTRLRATLGEEYR